jgi:hypothetical protein
MWILALAIIAAPAFGDESGPAELVRLLGSADRAEREEAARTLEELGAAALPALHDAEKAAPGEARSRAAFLARLIEGRQLVRPSLVAVDFDGRPLEEAIRTLAGRSGYTIQLDAGGDAALPRRPIVAQAPSPIPFWEALDRVGRAGHVRHDPGVGIWDRTRVPVLHIADGDPPSSTLYRGAFRVHLVGLHRRRDRDLGSHPGRGPSSRDVLYVDLQAFAEPGRFLDFDGMPRLEAEDDGGRPLPSPPADAAWSPPRSLSWNVPGAIGALQWRLPLGLPDPPAMTELPRLRGTLPVIVSATRPDPLVISLDDAPGQSYRHEETTLRLQSIQDAGAQWQVELILTQDPGRITSRDDRARGALRHRFGFEDRDGHPLSWLPLSENVGPGKETHIRILVSRGERPGRLRFHGLVWSATEIPFEFADVPLP